jgi:hypothetical protein
MKAVMTPIGVAAILCGGIVILAVLDGPTPQDFQLGYWHRLADDLLCRGTAIGLALLVTGVDLVLGPVFPTMEETGWGRRRAVLTFGVLVGAGTVAILMLLASVVVMVPGDGTRLVVIRLRAI